VVLTVISNPNTSISKIVELIRPVDEWGEIAFSGRQNAENEHCETLKKLVHKLNLHHWTFLYKTLYVVFVYCYCSNLSLHWEGDGLCRYFLSHHKYIQNLWLNKTRWRMIRKRIFRKPKFRKWSFETLKEVVHKLNFHH